MSLSVCLGGGGQNKKKPKFFKFDFESKILGIFGKRDPENRELAGKLGNSETPCNLVVELLEELYNKVYGILTLLEA